jgi:tetratricopeptide (TPR) repeat protein
LSPLPPGRLHTKPHVTAANRIYEPDKSGDVPTALLVLERALAIKEAVYGPGHHSVATTLNHLGAAQHLVGRRAEAVASLRQALTINESVYGPTHLRVAATLNNLGLVQRMLASLDEAEAMLQRARRIRLEVFGRDNLQTAIRGADHHKSQSLRAAIAVLDRPADDR